jgi:hypothetical protein
MLPYAYCGTATTTRAIVAGKASLALGRVVSPSSVVLVTASLAGVWIFGVAL